MRVEIDANGRRVTVDVADVNVTLDDVTARALAAWRATEEPAGTAPAFGFTTSGASSGTTVDRRALFRSGEPLPVRAERAE